MEDRSDIDFAVKKYWKFILHRRWDSEIIELNIGLENKGGCPRRMRNLIGEGIVHENCKLAWNSKKHEFKKKLGPFK